MKKPQDVQTCSTFDATSARWDWNCLAVARVVEADSFGGNLETASFLRLKIVYKNLSSTKRRRCLAMFVPRRIGVASILGLAG